MNVLVMSLNLFHGQAILCSIEKYISRKMPNQERDGIKIPNDRSVDYCLGRDMEEMQMRRQQVMMRQSEMYICPI
jgi:hypothetical protein